MNNEIEIRVPSSGEGEQITAVTAGIPIFHQGDVDTVRELWTEFSQKGDGESWYHFRAAYDGNKIVGFTCWGRRPLTQAAYDLYWIVVAADQHRRGIGVKLLRAAEEEIRKRGGYLLIAETAGKQEYEPTRRFYLGVGYEIEARIRDFYAPGDDLYIFTKRLQGISSKR